MTHATALSVASQRAKSMGRHTTAFVVLRRAVITETVPLKSPCAANAKEDTRASLARRTTRATELTVGSTVLAVVVAAFVIMGILASRAKHRARAMESIVGNMGAATEATAYAKRVTVGTDANSIATQLRVGRAQHAMPAAASTIPTRLAVAKSNALIAMLQHSQHTAVIYVAYTRSPVRIAIIKGTMTCMVIALPIISVTGTPTTRYATALPST